MPLIERLSGAMASSGAYAAIARIVSEGRDATVAAPGLVRPLLTAALFHEKPGPILVVLAGEEAAERFARQAAAFLEPGTVLRFPERQAAPWSNEAPDIAEVTRCARALHALSSGHAAIVVASARALLRALPPQGGRVFDPLVLEAGVSLDMVAAAATLSRMGYERADVAGEPGQFAVRGGTLDVYPGDGSQPLRAEFLGDEIETLRRFVPSTGQSIGDAGRSEVFCCREVALSTRAALRAQRALGARALKNPELAHHLELMTQGVYFNGIERYLPYLYEQQGTLTDYLSADTLIVVAEPRSLFDDATRRFEELT
ncbi:MAG: transcription-repair coupling factor, partial [Actinomycetota bacterium]|nr:transcription-repair coupling factor [Actinomycetota bacterium]